MHRREFLLSATGIVGATSVGSIAYTNASVDRGVTATVKSDDTAIIQLAPNTSVDGVGTTGGKLDINVTEGLNKNGTFEYGDYTTPSNTPAFTITNNDTVSRNITVSIDATNGSLSLKLEGPSSNKNEVQSGGSYEYTSVSAGDSIQAAVKIGTSGTNTTDGVDATMTFGAE